MAAATTTLPLLLMSLPFLFFSSSHISFCLATTIQGQVPSSVTAKAAAVHYWNLKTHNYKPLPPILLSRLSPLSPTEMTANYAAKTPAENGDLDSSNNIKMVKSDEVKKEKAEQTGGHVAAGYEQTGGDVTASYVTASYDAIIPTENGDTASYEQSGGDLTASYEQTGGDATASYEQTGGEATASYEQTGGDVTASYATATYDAAKIPTENGDTASYDAMDSSINIKMVTNDEVKKEKAEQTGARLDPQGIFFRESILKEGTTIPLLKIAGTDTGSSQYFLPRSVANKIPFSASAVSKILNIPTDSTMYSAMKRSMAHCRMPPNTGETKQCVTSAEDMIDYVLSTLGADADIQVWSTHDSSGFEGKSLIGKVKVVYDGKLTAKKHVTCHKVTFPYLVYHCHSVFRTRIYDFEVLDAETKEKINQGAAVCHLDTSAWDPRHMSFMALASAPGKTEVCHLILPGDMAWTAGHVVAAATAP